MPNNSLRLRTTQLTRPDLSEVPPEPPFPHRLINATTTAEIGAARTLTRVSQVGTIVCLSSLPVHFTGVRGRTVGAVGATTKPACGRTWGRRGDGDAGECRGVPGKSSRGWGRIGDRSVLASVIAGQRPCRALWRALWECRSARSPRRVAPLASTGVGMSTQRTKRVHRASAPEPVVITFVRAVIEQAGARLCRSARCEKACCYLNAACAVRCVHATLGVLGAGDARYQRSSPAGSVSGYGGASRQRPG